MARSSTASRGTPLSLGLGRVFGIRLEVHLTFLLLVLLFGWQGYANDAVSGMAWSLLLLVLFFVCVVLHELGHSLVAQRYGVGIARILLLPIGGMAQFDRLPQDPVKELLITGAGPAVNFVLAGFLYLIFGWPDWSYLAANPYSFTTLAETLLLFNLLMGVFNLLPVFPMDGGRLLRALFALRLDYLTATRWAVWVAKPFAIAGILAALFLLQNFLLAILFAFIYWGGDLEYRAVRQRQDLQALQAGMLSRPPDASCAPHTSWAEIARLMRTRHPREIVIREPHSPWVVHILSAEALARLARKQRGATHPTWPDEPPPSPIEAWWSAEAAADIVTRHGAGKHPVYDHGEFVGILDHDQLLDAAWWYRLMQRRVQTPRDEEVSA